MIDAPERIWFTEFGECGFIDNGGTEYVRAGEKRALEMPTAQDALRVMIAAEQRLQELGWWRGGGLRIKRGDECAVAETGSTGMWRGRLDAEGKYVHHGDCVSDPRKCWLKPLSDLTDGERAWMEECDRREAEAYEAMLGRYASLNEAQEPADD